MSYDGAGLCGWQIQPQEPSVQEAVERALGTLLRARIAVTGAGRTDTGVSASHYVAHFDFDGLVPTPLQFHVVDGLLSEDGSLSDNCLDCNQLRYKLNAVLPKTVSVQRVEPVDPDFHARFGAKKRQYTYFLHRAKDPFVGGYSYYFAYPEFDVEAMNRAASLLLGTHDFSCFEKSGGDNKTSICTVVKALWEPYTPTVCSGGVPQINGSGFLSQKDVPTDSSGAVSDCADAVSNRAGAVSEADGAVSDRAGAVSEADRSKGEPLYWRFTIEADRFLRNMVRAIVGTLLEVGRGRRSLADFSALILPPSPASAAAPSSSIPSPSAQASPSQSSSPESTLASSPKAPSRRSEAGESVPGHALFLSDIQY